MTQGRFKRALRRFPWIRGIFLALAILPTPFANASPPIPSPAAPTAESVAREAQALFRQAASRGVMTLRMASPKARYQAKIEFWTLGEDRALLRLAEPPRERGKGLLRNGASGWRLDPTKSGGQPLARGELAQPWLGMDFTLGDILFPPRWHDDYQAQPLATQPSGRWCVGLTRKPGISHPPAQSELCIETATGRLTTRTDMDEAGARQRQWEYLDWQEKNGHPVPTQLRLSATDGSTQGRRSELVYDKLEFDVGIEAALFELHTAPPTPTRPDRVRGLAPVRPPTPPRGQPEKGRN